MSLFAKLIISFVLILVIPIVVISTAVYYNTLSYFEKEIYNTNKDRLLMTKSMTETALNEALKDAKNIGLNQSIESLSHLDESSLKTNIGISKSADVAQVLYNTKLSNNNIFSIYLYNYNTDLIYTSDRVVQKKNIFYDTDWIDEFEKNNENAVWLDTRNAGIESTNVNSAKNSMSGKQQVLTLVYPVKYISTFNGLIAINILEDKLSSVINDSAKGMENTYIINSDGMILTSSQKGMANYIISSRDYIKEIINSKEKDGFITALINGRSFLVSYSKASDSDWIYISEYSFENILSKVNVLRNIIFIITAILALLGIPVCFFLSRKLYNPVKKLVENIKAQKGINLTESKNEMVVISSALNDVMKQGNQIMGVMERNSKKLSESYILALLRGNENYEETPFVKFNETNFICVIIALDNVNSFFKKHTSEERYYLMELVLNLCIKIINSYWTCFGVQYEKDKIVLIINYKTEETDELKLKLEEALVSLKQKLYEILDSTVTISTGSCYSGKEKIEASFQEACKMLKFRMIYGSNKIILPWKTALNSNMDYYYPTSIENRIFNFLKLGMKDELLKAVDEFIEDIKNRNLSYDNIIQILNQLIGNIVKHMISVRMNPSDLFSGKTTMYQYLSSLETLDDVKVWIINIFHSIIDYVEIRDESKNRYIEQIQEYVKVHYKDEIDFENLADTVGISYSHMRKLFRDELNTSITDYINKIRIEKAKLLMKNSDMTLQEIAEKIGYQNIQSFKRFFKKYEGIAPAEFRKI